MAPRSRRPDSAELGHRIWDHMRGRAKNAPEEFAPDTRDDVEGWLWEGVVASLIREAIPGIADSDLRRAREYLNASGMVLNVRGHQRGGGQPQWFIRASWHQGPGGHVHVVTARRPGPPAAGKAGGPTAPEAGQPAGAGAGLPGTAAADQVAAGGGPAEEVLQPRQDIMEALQSLVQQISELHSDNDRLRRDNDHLRRDNDLLRAEIRRIRALMREAGAEIARRAGELLADTGEHPHLARPLWPADQAAPARHSPRLRLYGGHRGAGEPGISSQGGGFTMLTHRGRPTGRRCPLGRIFASEGFG